jgi:hypothetical protein
MNAVLRYEKHSEEITTKPESTDQLYWHPKLNRP